MYLHQLFAFTNWGTTLQEFPHARNDSKLELKFCLGRCFEWLLNISFIL